MAKPPSQGALLYHITHIDNMPSILQHGLLPRAEVQAQGLHFTDIADPEILSKRQAYNRALSQYVLFHFYPKNPFDGAVCKTHGSENMVLITINRAEHLNHDFYIIPSHPLDKDTPEIYPYEEGFDRIQWDILDRKVGNRDYHDPEVRKACMAECVMSYAILPQAFSLVFVENEFAKSRILAMENSDQISLKVAPYMFP